MNLIKKNLNNLSNILGWRTNRKIVVIESDDWGSIRMPSKKTYDYCIRKGYQAEKNIFSKYDSLASEEDLVFLFETLSLFRDKNGNYPVLTANTLTCNPDFEKIKKSNFEFYSNELITETFKKYPKHSQCWELWNEGIQNRLFHPQFHGREHLNVSRFMNDLRNNNEDAHFALNQQMPGIFPKNNVDAGNNYVVALEHYNENDLVEKGKIISDGLEIFQSLFNYSSNSFIATNYTWDDYLNNTLSSNGVKFLQGSKFQLIPKGKYNGFRKKINYIGKTNKANQTYLVRNVFFEPTLSKGNVIDSCIKQIDTAFKWKKPAIISSHRINYVGYIDPNNRDQSLVLLKRLLNEITKRWPEVEFMTSDQLGNTIELSRKN